MQNNKTKPGLLLLAMAMLAMPMQAQNLKITVNKKGKVGFVDKDGKVVVKCIYDSASPFSDGVSIVSKSGKSGIINTSGKELLPLKYTQISSWTPNVYLIKNGKKVGLATHHGEILLAPKYSHISKPNCYGKALIALGGKATTNNEMMYMVGYDLTSRIPIGKGTYLGGAKYGVVDTNGKILIQPKYRALYEFAIDGKDFAQFHEGKAMKFSYHYLTDTLATNCEYVGYSTNFYTLQKSGVLSSDGTILVKCGLYDYVAQPINGMVRYYKKGKKNSTLCGYHNISTGKSMEVTKFNSQFTDIREWTHGDFIGDIAPVNNGASWSFINKSGASVRSDYQEVRHGQYVDLWAAQESSSGKWQVFDNNNQDISALSGYDDFLYPVNKGDKEVFTVKKDGKYGCVNRSGVQVVPFAYEQAEGNTYDIVPVKQDGKWGAVSPSGEIVVPTEFANVVKPSEKNARHFWVQKSDSLYYHYNVSTNALAQDGYKRVSNFRKRVAHVAPADMKVEDCMLVRAQLFAPNTAKSVLYEADLEKNKSSFGYIVADNDVVLVDQPVSTLYVDAVMKKLTELGNKVPTEIEEKNILLDITRENRSYELKVPIGEEEWNY